MSRSELAEAVNAYIWDASGKRTRTALDAHTIARYERGDVRWPGAAYRAGLRAVLNVATDTDLGFVPVRRGRVAAPAQSATVDYRGRVDLGAPPADFLDRITAETPIPARIGWSEVGNVRSTTRAVAMSEKPLRRGPVVRGRDRPTSLVRTAS